MKDKREEQVHQGISLHVYFYVQFKPSNMHCVIRKVVPKQRMERRKEGKTPKEVEDAQNNACQAIELHLPTI